MALTTPLPEVQGSRISYGINLQSATFLIVPAASDYPTNGYIITALACRMKMIQQAIVTGCNSTAAATWEAIPIFPETQLSTGPGYSGYSQFLLYVYALSTGSQVAALGNLTGAIWQVQAIGY